MIKRNILTYIFLFFIFVFGVFASNQVLAVTQENQESQNSPVFFYYFYGDGCPFCDKVEEYFFPGLKERNPGLEIRKIEVWHCRDNAKFFGELAENNFDLDLAKLGVPVMFIGKYYFIGLPGERDEERIERIVQHCLIYGCPNPQDITPKHTENIREIGYVTLPFVGEIYIADFSFPVITIIIAAADGFNPCALWILIFLILLVLKEPSRKRLILIVGTFILVSGIFYFFLLSAWLKLFLFIGYIRTIQLIIGIVALGVGVLQMKSFFSKNSGTCKLSKKGAKLHNIISERAKKVIAEKSIFLTIIGVSILAVMVNFFEFLCSAGFPAIWSSLLALQGFDPIHNILFTLLYVFVFMLDQIIIFTIAFFTLKVTTIGEKITKWTGLIGGVLMIVLGLIILFRPEWLIFA
jgi:thiol-disulfide isomerase/thioredoxin